MTYRDLLRQSAEMFYNNPVAYPVNGLAIFSDGGIWMQQQLCQLRHGADVLPRAIPFTFYGLLKYGICLAAFGLSVVLFYKVNIMLLPLSILVFYVVEVHFLFLFPLLIDGVKNPLLASIKQTYKTGLLRAVLTVIPIGMYMVSGLFSFREPLRRWFTGCLAILIWYQYEVTDRK